jgi:hypothetical protein
MSPELMLFLEENGFSESGIWLGEFSKEIYSEYVDELMVSVLVDIVRQALTLNISGRAFFNINFVIQSNMDRQNKVKKILGIIPDVVKLSFTNGFPLGTFFDYEIIEDSGYRIKTNYEDMLISDYAIIHISGDEAVLKLKE